MVGENRLPEKKEKYNRLFGEGGENRKRPSLGIILKGVLRSTSEVLPSLCTSCRGPEE